MPIEQGVRLTLGRHRRGRKSSEEIEHFVTIAKVLARQLSDYERMHENALRLEPGA